MSQILSKKEILSVFLKETTDPRRDWGKFCDQMERFFMGLWDNKDITRINAAMTNFIRIIWELETCEEHDLLDTTKAKEDIDLDKIRLYLNGLYLLSDSEYKDEINRLFGEDVNGKKDPDMLLLKSLVSAGRHYDDKYDMRRIYERVYNSLYRRKILKHIPLLKILKKYREEGAEKRFYEIILENCGKNWNSNDGNNPFDEKECLLVQILWNSCIGNDEEIPVNEIPIPLLVIFNRPTDIEEEFWRVCRRDIKSHEIWNGDLSVLIGWSFDETGKFDLAKFRHYSDAIDTMFSGKDEEECRQLIEKNTDAVRKSIGEPGNQTN